MVKFPPMQPPQRVFIQKAITFIRRLLFLAAIFLLILAGLGGSKQMPPQTISQKAQALTRGIEFDFVSWTLDALRSKLLDFSLGASKYLVPQTRSHVVLSYLELIRQIKELESTERQIYGDPNVTDPQAVAASTHQKLAALYDERSQIAPLAETILEGQVNTITNDLGLDIGGQAIPPVLFHSTPLPLLLVISPRDVIRREADVSLVPDLSVEEQVDLEKQVDNSLDVSSLVVPIGGVGAYPTMVNETSNLEWLSEVISHEWIHNFLTIRPLGMSYLNSPELRTMNETAASIAGKEIGRALLEKYYPEMAPPPALANPANPAPATQPPAFDFNKEMHTTRVKVDALLAEGKVDEAEAYMEQRRQLFWEHGYSIRKLNQAYFAFYGAYADEPLGPAGEDPVGAAVRTLRSRSPSLSQFLFTISHMTSFEQLKQAIQHPG
jgi:hypothetical protein